MPSLSNASCKTQGKERGEGNGRKAQGQAGAGQCRPRLEDRSRPLRPVGTSVSVYCAPRHRLPSAHVPEPLFLAYVDELSTIIASSNRCGSPVHLPCCCPSTICHVHCIAGCWVFKACSRSHIWVLPLTISPSWRVVPDELMSISMGRLAPCFSRYSSSATMSSVTAGTNCKKEEHACETRWPAAWLEGS
jgi:hypothetical protein